MCEAWKDWNTLLFIFAQCHEVQSWQSYFTEMKMNISGTILSHCLVRLFISFLLQLKYQLLAWENTIHKIFIKYTKSIQTYIFHVRFTTIILVLFINKEALRCKDAIQCHRKVVEWVPGHTALLTGSHSPLSLFFIAKLAPQRGCNIISRPI